MHHADYEREFDINLLARVYGEYMEMPGLQLTLAQASRLWNISLATGAHVLQRLVDVSFLRQSGDRYIRADSGRVCG